MKKFRQSSGKYRRRRRLEIRRLRSILSSYNKKPLPEHSHPDTSSRYTSSSDSGGRAEINLRRKEEEEEEWTSESKISNSTTNSRGLVYGHVSMMGRRRVMEDALAVGRFGDQEGYWYFGVYDGHGGDKVAEACSRGLHKYLEKHIQKYMEKGKDQIVDDWEEVMAESFRTMDAEIGELDRTSRDEGGSTAVLVLVSTEEVVAANCGDSRVVLCRGGVAVPLSKDHKPDRPDEKERIESAGGMVLNWNGWRVQGVLATSRSLGDHYLRPYVTSEPEVTVERRSESDEFLIIATDGLWDVVCNGLACHTVQKCLSTGRWRPTAEQAGTNSSIAFEAAAQLAEVAISKGSRDNITVIVVLFGS